MTQVQTAPSGAKARLTSPGWFEPLFALVVPAVLIAVVYLKPFATDPSTMPFGVDTSTYIWRVNVVHDLGIGSLTPEVTNAPKPLGDRPGYPIALSLLRSVTGLSSLSLMWLTPALLACALGLAAGSLAADGALERRRRAGAVAVAVGGSAFVAWTAVGYAANLAFDVVAMAVAVMTLEVARGRRGVWGGALLLAGGVLLHWMFAAVFVVVLGVTIVVQFVRSRSREANPRRPAVKRLATMLVLGVAIGAAGLVLSSQHPARLPEVQPGRPGPAGRLELRLPALALPLTLPLAGLGATLLALDQRRGRRNAAVLLGIWSSTAVVSLLAWYMFDLPLPPYRWAGFALAIPMLIVLGVFALGDRLERLGRHGVAIIAVSFGLAATVGLVGAGAAVWWSREPTLAAGEFAQLRTLTSYLEPLPLETRVVILLEPHRRHAPFNRAWAGLPAERLAHVTMIAARVKLHAPDYGLGPDVLDGPRTVVVALDAYRKPLDSGHLLGPGVHLIAGPVPRDVQAGVPPRAPSGIALAFTLAVLLAVLLLTGVGWAALSDLPALGIVSVAPAFGLAILSCTGFVASRLGVPLHGLAGAGLVCGIALAGWVAAILRRARPDAATSREGSDFPSG
jgi:hypothetical protein